MRGSSGGGVVPPLPQRIWSRRVTTEWPNFYKTANAKWREQQETTPRDTGRKRERSSLLLGHQKRNRGQRAGFAKRPKRRPLFCGGGKGQTQKTLLFLQTEIGSCGPASQEARAETHRRLEEGISKRIKAVAPLTGNRQTWASSAKKGSPRRPPLFLGG